MIKPHAVAQLVRALFYDSVHKVFIAVGPSVPAVLQACRGYYRDIDTRSCKSEYKVATANIEVFAGHNKD